MPLTELSPDDSLDSIPPINTEPSNSITLSTESSVTPFLPPAPKKKMKTLPRRTACGAPEFDGKALNLARYWEDVEELAEALERGTDPERIKIAMRYISREDEVLWKACNQPGPPPATWAELDQGPGVVSGDLQTLLSERSLKKIRDKDDFSEYHRRFRTIASHLLAEGKMSAIEEQREFPKGMDEQFRNCIYQRLQIVKPHHPSDTPYTLEDMVKAAKHILDKPADAGGDGADTSFIKKEMVDLGEAFAKMNTRYHVDMQSLQRAGGNIPGQLTRPTYPMYQATVLETVAPPV
ncbi:hypothetical protein FB451DRAFT_1176468 [Mycena latifolia]|nr:hypothetical protein FB451DRAFT_1176468 [Mycena latifolia]